MRARFIEIPSMVREDGWKVAIAGWWADWPCRKRWFWRELLFQPGQGWLRWGIEQGQTVTYDRLDVEEYMFVPPLRRAWIYVRAWLFVPRAMLIGTGEPRYRWSWEEARPCTGGSLWTDPDRYTTLWEWDWRTERRRRRARKRAELEMSEVEKTS